MTFEPTILFSGAVANSAVLYVAIPVRDGCIGAQLSWKDATSSGTVTLELTSGNASLTTAGAAWEWKDSGLTITGPIAAAAGSTVINIENVRQQRARLKFLAAAASNIDVWDGTA